VKVLQSGKSATDLHEDFLEQTEGNNGYGNCPVKYTPLVTKLPVVEGIS
jgi:hypothetical protein